jgi:O-methyltransferase
MKIKSLFPLPIKRLFRKMQWIVNNYDSIGNIQVNKPNGNHYHGPITYDTDGLTTSNNSDFVKDPRFVRAYNAAAATNPWAGFTLQWRVYTVCWFADHVKKLQGEFVECGVNTGAYARAVIEYTDFNSLGKTFYLFDTFQGLDESLVSDEEKKAGISIYLGDHYKDVYQQVLNTFKPFNAKIVKGSVPYTLNQFAHKSVSFLSIDMNCVAPEIAAAEFFWEKLVPGAIIILDDYGFAPHVQQKLAFDKFAKEKNVSILSLPTGQGVIIKP